MENNTHHPVAIANYFIRLGKDQKGLTLMQLLKLSYIAHGFKLALSGNALSFELVQAWKYGPVFPHIYNKFKYNAPGKIKSPGTCLSEDRTSLTPIKSNFRPEEIRIMDVVYDIYGSLEGWRLSTLTHQEGTPWHEIWNDQGKLFHGVTIPNKMIKNYFKTEILHEYIPK